MVEERIAAIISSVGRSSWAIIGRSGAKTTLLRCLARATTAGRGVIRFGDIDLATLRRPALRAHRARVGMIYQQFKPHRLRARLRRSRARPARELVFNGPPRELTDATLVDIFEEYPAPLVHEETSLADAVVARSPPAGRSAT